MLQLTFFCCLISPKNDTVTIKEAFETVRKAFETKSNFVRAHQIFVILKSALFMFHSLLSHIDLFISPLFSIDITKSISIVLLLISFLELFCFSGSFETLSVSFFNRKYNP